jgi:MYXO-CTERM domain-containing protein
MTRSVTSSLTTSIAAIACCAAAHAGLVVYGTEADFGAAAAGQGLGIESQSFTQYAGSYANLAGTCGGVDWSLGSSNTVAANGGVVSTADGGDSITFNFAGTPTTAIGGNFFALSGTGSRISTVAIVKTADGQSYVTLISSLNSFRGFVSTGSAIVQLSLTPYTNFSSRPSVDRLLVGTAPAPGALALAGLAGLLGTRRRRA